MAHDRELNRQWYAWRSDEDVTPQAKQRDASIHKNFYRVTPTGTILSMTFRGTIPTEQVDYRWARRSSVRQTSEISSSEHGAFDFEVLTSAQTIYQGQPTF